MLPDFKVDRFVDQFVIGSLVFLGAWYLHRPFLHKYFPNLAADPASRAPAQFDSQVAIALFIVASVVVGVLLTHTADVAIVASFIREPTGKLDRSHRRWLRAFARPFTLMPALDPRVSVVARYRDSPRGQVFLRMLQDWSMSTSEGIQRPDEAILAHEHLVAHLRTMNEHTRAAVEEAYAPVMFAGALFLAFCALVVISALSFWTAPLVSELRKVQPTAVRVVTTVFLYIGAVMTGYSLRRRFRDFCNGIVTTALHFYLTSLEDRSHLDSGKR
jgi:hypothetical protein